MILEADFEKLQAAVNLLTADIDTLAKRIGAVEAECAGIGTLATRIAAVETQLSPIV